MGVLSSSLQKMLEKQSDFEFIVKIYEKQQYIRVNSCKFKRILYI